MNDETRERESDRLLRGMLAEALDRVQPPDLTERIAKELIAEDSAPAIEDPNITVRRRRYALHMAAAVVAFALGIIWSASSAFEEDALPHEQIEMLALHGTVRFVGDGASHPIVFEPGVTRRVAVEPGDRLTSGQEGATLKLVPLGVLQFDQNTVIEVSKMQWARRDGIMIVSSMTLGAVAGAFTWNSVAAGDTITMGNEQQITRQAEGRGSSDLSSKQELQEEIDRLAKENKALKTAIGRTQIPEGAKDENDPALDSEETESAPKSSVAFDHEKYGEALAKVDWKVMGKNMKDMIPLLTKMAEVGVEDMEPDDVVKLTQLNTELIQQTSHLMAAKMPGSGMNGAFTHPITAANQISSALDAAGLGLDAQQKSALAQTMKFYAAKDDALRMVEGSRELKLTNLIEEIELRSQFYEEARNLMTAEQRNTLYSESTQGRVGFDIFGTGVMLQLSAKPVRAANSAEFASRFSGNLGSGLRLDPPARAQLDKVVSEWAAALPADHWKVPAKTSRGLPVDMVRKAAVRQQELMNRILRDVNLTPKARTKLRENLKVFVPVPSAK